MDFLTIFKSIFEGAFEKYAEILHCPVENVIIVIGGTEVGEPFYKVRMKQGEKTVTYCKPDGRVLLTYKELVSWQHYTMYKMLFDIPKYIKTALESIAESEKIPFYKTSALFTWDKFNEEKFIVKYEDINEFSQNEKDYSFEYFTELLN